MPESPTEPGRDRPALALTAPIEEVPGVTRAQAEAFRRLGVPSLAHLVHHIPHRHEREEAEGTIASVGADRNVATRGEVTETRVAGPAGRRRFRAVIADDTGSVELVWFNQPYLAKRIHAGMELRVEGKARDTGRGLQIANPRWRLLGGEGEDVEARAERLRPVYPATEDLPSWQIEKVIAGVLDGALPLIEDHFDDAERRRLEMPPLRGAYRMMHRPEDEGEVAEARRRLVYDELLLAPARGAAQAGAPACDAPRARAQRGTRRSTLGSGRGSPTR